MLRTSIRLPLACFALTALLACGGDDNGDVSGYWEPTGVGGASGSGGRATGGSGGATGGSGGDTGGSGGATGGSGGATGGSGGATGGSGGATGGSGGSGDGCSVTLPGATGNEPGGIIPVCCAPNATEKAFIDEMFAALNDYRTQNGVGALTYDNALESAIQAHCIHMGTHSFFDHDAPEGPVSSPWTRAELCGTTANAENIASGGGSVSGVMTMWQGSPGHNANMLDPGLSRVGIGRYESLTAQIFGR